jgi:hypothetical protein
MTAVDVNDENNSVVVSAHPSRSEKIEPVKKSVGSRIAGHNVKIAVPRTRYSLFYITLVGFRQNTGAVNDPLNALCPAGSKHRGAKHKKHRRKNIFQGSHSIIPPKAPTTRATAPATAPKSAASLPMLTGSFP